MPGELKVHFETLAEATEELDSVAKALEEHLAELDRAVSRIAESWEGDAHEAFHGYYQQWSSASRSLHRTVRTLHKSLRTAHGNYSAARAANLRMWGRR
ncbi:WXG100 family type VII secretion target [Streptomyces guryensis]|uniref:ESAT-6-like protein n=1 Tax=Streptomyces guryensis TaxID=2886947 RepID=A0A9Q3Z3N2_9ACTN|nr:WXG100 family type VII secretion target [Streptomyces guryensis]MCD9872098.1 WXG100 family type VII secretion target [Streptomyces guryensis]